MIVYMCLYGQVCKSTFDYIENKQHFDALRSTRHFGNLTFHLVVEKRIDSLLAYCVQQRRCVCVKCSQLPLKIAQIIANTSIVYACKM